MVDQQVCLFFIVSSFILFSCENETSPNFSSMTLDWEVEGRYDQDMVKQIVEDEALSYDLEAPEPTGRDPLDCDPLLENYCTLPWPSDHFQDESKNGAFQFSQDSLPKNFQGVGFDPVALSQLNGYGLLATGIVYFPDLDLSQLPDETQIEESLSNQAVVALFELNEDNGSYTAQKIPCWAEPDLRDTSEESKTIFIRPAALLKPDQRYMYALIDLRNSDGERLASSPAFKSLRDGLGIHPEGDRLISAARRIKFEKAFVALQELGIRRADLTLAWTFKTASTSSLTSDLLSMRAQTTELIETIGIEFQLDEVITFRRSTDQLAVDDERRLNEHIAYELRGSYSVPSFMESDNQIPGQYQLRRNQMGQPLMNDTIQAPFWLRIPYSVMDGQPAGIIVYGHGQLYSGAEVRMSDKGPVADLGRYIYLGTDLWGMSETELPLIPQILNQMDRFKAIAERLQQGVLNHLVLAKAAKMELAGLDWLIQNGININIERVVYGGISQGGIFGPTILSLSQDITRGHMGVPGMHYFTLIGRSRNFNAMFSLLSVAYADPVERWIILASAQLLWNKTDPSTYYRHLHHEPLPDTPVHHVLLTPAQGDPQVAQITIEHLARSHLNIPIIGQYGENSPPLIDRVMYPHQGSGIVGWHYGPRAPSGAGPAPQQHHDPHELPRHDPLHNQQMIHFWDTGEVIDVCEERLCGRRMPQ